MKRANGIARRAAISAAISDCRPRACVGGGHRSGRRRRALEASGRHPSGGFVLALSSTSLWTCMIPSINASGRGGQPGM